VTHAYDRHCPKCGAPAKTPCQGKRGDRKSFHRERWIGQTFCALAGDDDTDTESPIELKLLQAIRGWLFHNDLTEKYVARTQVRIGKYRADIVVIDSFTCERLAVECDGREWHTAPDQVSRDKRRDRWFASQGIPVMRFSGSEIHRDARGCAAQIGEWVVRRK
jgi:very-short-patch-repair endonuclease